MGTQPDITEKIEQLVSIFKPALYAISLLVPIVGIVLGAVLESCCSSRETKAVARKCIVIGAIVMIALPVMIVILLHRVNIIVGTPG